MPSFTFKDLKISVGTFGGNFRIQLRDLDVSLTKDQLAAEVYPIFDAQEKALHPAPVVAEVVKKRVSSNMNPVITIQGWRPCVDHGDVIDIWFLGASVKFLGLSFLKSDLIYGIRFKKEELKKKTMDEIIKSHMEERYGGVGRVV